MTNPPSEFVLNKPNGQCEELLCSLAKLVQKTDRPNRNRNDADRDAESRVRTGDDPAHASADYSERNDVR